MTAVSHVCVSLHPRVPQADLLTSKLEPPGAAVALQVQALAAQGQVAACHIQALDCPQLEAAALAVLIQTTCAFNNGHTYDKGSHSVQRCETAMQHGPNSLHCHVCTLT